MIEPWINATVIAVLGILTGAVLGFFTALTSASIDVRNRIGARPDFSSFANFRKSAERSAEKGREQWSSASPFTKATMLSFYGLIAALIAVIKYTPLTMNWTAYLVGLFAAFIAVTRIFGAARKGRLSAD